MMVSTSLQLTFLMPACIIGWYLNPLFLNNPAQVQPRHTAQDKAF